MKLHNNNIYKQWEWYTKNNIYTRYIKKKYKSTITQNRGYIYYASLLCSTYATMICLSQVRDYQ